MSCDQGGRRAPRHCVDADELEDLYSGKTTGKLRVPSDMRETMHEIGLSDLLAPVNLITVTETAEILVSADAWKDIELEVALDSALLFTLARSKKLLGVILNRYSKLQL